MYMYLKVFYNFMSLNPIYSYMYKYALSLGVSSLCLLAFIPRRFVLQLTWYVGLVLKTEEFVVWNIFCILFRLHSRYLMAYLYSIVEYMSMCNTPNPLNFFFIFTNFIIFCPTYFSRFHLWKVMQLFCFWQWFHWVDQLADIQKLWDIS